MSFRARRLAASSGAPEAAGLRATRVRRAIAQALGQGEFGSAVLNAVAMMVLRAKAPEGMADEVDRVRAEFLVAAHPGRLKSQLLNTLGDPRWPDDARAAAGRMLVSRAAAEGFALAGALAELQEALGDRPR